MKLKAWQYLAIGIIILAFVIVLIKAFEIQITLGQMLIIGILLSITVGGGYLIYWYFSDHKGVSKIDREVIRKYTIEHWLKEHSIDIRSLGDPNHVKYNIIIDTCRPNGEHKWFSKIVYRDNVLGVVCLLLYFDNRGKYEGEKMLCELYGLDHDLMINPELVYTRRPERTESQKSVKEKAMEKMLDEGNLDPSDIKE